MAKDKIGADQLLTAEQKAVVIAADDDSDRPPWAGGNPGENPNRPTDQGKPDNAGTKKGDVYGDQYVLYRDLSEDGNGEPVLDGNGNPILVGSDDPSTPIFLTDEDGDGKYEVPADELEYVQEVELGRANVARAPQPVMNKAFDAAWAKIVGANSIEVDPAGRIVCDGATIDAPLENLALYQHLMTGGDTGPLSGLENWDPSSLLGAAWDKFGEIGLDEMVYENVALGIHDLEGDYFDFGDYDHNREARYQDTTIYWYEDKDGDGLLEPHSGSVFNVVFGGEEWTDQYLSLDIEDPSTNTDTKFGLEESPSGVDDFAQAADDARAVIQFMHENMGSGEPPAEVAVEALLL